MVGPAASAVPGLVVTEVATKTIRGQKSHHAAERASRIAGYRLVHGGPFFREFVLECPVDASRVAQVGRERGILPGVDLGRFRPEWKKWMLVAVTEQRSAEDIERWLEVLGDVGGAA